MIKFNKLKKSVSLLLSLALFLSALTLPGICAEDTFDTIPAEDEPGRVVTYGVRITSSPSAMIVGSGVAETYQIEYEVSPLIPVPNLVWTSGDTSVLTVSQTGLLTAVSEGTTYVTVQITPAISNFICVDSVMVTVRQLDDGIFRIKNYATSNYMTLSRAWNYNEVNIHQRSLNNVINNLSYNAQEFRFIYDSASGAYYIKPINSGNGYFRCVESQYSYYDCNIRINLCESTSSSRQLFRVVGVGSGQFKIVLNSNTSCAICTNGSGEGVDDPISNPAGPNSNYTADGNIILSYNSASGTLYNNYKWILEFSERNNEEDYYTGLNLRFPLPNGSLYRKIWSGFGYRQANHNAHAGLDLNAGSNTNVYAAFAGKVERARMGDNGEGNYITIKASSSTYHAYNNSSKKLSTVYMHLNGFNVQANDIVAKGDIVGYSGNTGGNYGYHLHMSIITDGTLYVGLKRCADPMMFYRNEPLYFA
ncbi:MAG: peptidoglycan DD-metalloendopeptidase family protein [Clostridia bacterium]|nr:peptidoglycan DD-metalloendopeptidase family protein [Clostridia bacterium]